MRPRLLAFVSFALALSVIAVGCGATQTVTQTTTVTKTVSAVPVGQTAAPSHQWLYGHIASMKPVQGGYEMMFDPALFLGGIAANYAAAQAQGVHCDPSACQSVPNDYLVVDESHRLYAFLLPTNAEIHVMLKQTNYFPEARITAAQLAALVATGKAQGVELFETLDSGVWIEDDFGTVRAVYQQYRP
jgi:hypothetical protein